MLTSKKAYADYVKKTAPKSPILKNCVFAFASGGGICAFAEGLKYAFSSFAESETEAKLYVTLTLIFLTSALTGIGLYDKLAKHAGAGAFVPITGFANSMSSSALDTKSEGMILGVGKQMFTVAGPVLVYGISSSVLYGAVYYIARRLGA